MTINTIKSMHKYVVVADLLKRSADFVVSIQPNKYMNKREKNM